MRVTVSPPRPSSLLLEGKSNSGFRDSNENVVLLNKTESSLGGSQPARRKKKKRPANATVKKFEGFFKL